ncbi:hypothetical protein NM680_11670 [Paracoccus sp. PS-1]|uniref:hypothetical protein n=1 Tax=Paracoccus sp. PS1 TaxID=2963938 RepID=UPI0027E51D1D|nr:hypothetical protein [Paracoccus sp. PS1]MDQ7262452.1 hypothetical protein [Paracoccus sp. PS1]
MSALRPIPSEVCRGAIKAVQEGGWTRGDDLMLDAAAMHIMGFQASDEAIEHARAYLRPALEALRQEAE